MLFQWDITHDVIEQIVSTFWEGQDEPEETRMFAEALAAGTPTIVSDGVALHTEVTAGQVGATVPVGDIKALSAELERWLDDDALRNAAAGRARPFASERFDWSKIAARWVEHYQKLKGT